MNFKILPQKILFFNKIQKILSNILVYSSLNILIGVY
ncbi:hypothetical protein HPMG_01834 [Helicobacter pullorum MIT 98-5489]|uniref:Uncharacterized protein n=1 Tax=Helicobacter pullorum MIT 98-5489 TaxID=537972 RepID=C5F283_9HELI|nr:hypothetical protein HPMG_01834 [Helicobacter pullorum MIT 98-5489]